jgi:hypothetical protein
MKHTVHSLRFDSFPFHEAELCEHLIRVRTALQFYSKISQDIMFKIRDFWLEIFNEKCHNHFLFDSL